MKDYFSLLFLFILFWGKFSKAQWNISLQVELASVQIQSSLAVKAHSHSNQTGVSNLIHILHTEEDTVVALGGGGREPLLADNLFIFKK